LNFFKIWNDLADLVTQSKPGTRALDRAGHQAEFKNYGWKQHKKDNKYKNTKVFEKWIVQRSQIIILLLNIYFKIIYITTRFTIL
jgi:hypothetical protein